MPKYFSPDFLKMSQSIAQFRSLYKANVQMRWQQIKLMETIQKESVGQEEKPQGDKKKLEVLRQRLENILVYVHEAIAQECRLSNTEPESDPLYILIEKALGIDAESNKTNDCHVVFLNRLPLKEDLEKLKPKTFVIYKNIDVFDSSRLEKEAAQADGWIFTNKPKWCLCYRGQYEGDHSAILPEEISGLMAVLAALPKNNNVEKTPYTEANVKPVKDVLLSYHQKTHTNRLDDQTIFTDLIRLRVDIGRKVIAFSQADELVYFKDIDKLAKRSFDRLGDINALIQNRPPSFKALLAFFNKVIDADTSGMMSGNQKQLQIFLKILHSRADTSDHASEEKTYARHPNTMPDGFQKRYGALLFCILVYEKLYYRKWPFFEEAMAVANIHFSSNEVKNIFKSLYLSALDNYITRVLSDENMLRDFEHDKLDNPRAFLTWMQETIAEDRKIFNSAAANGVDNPKAHKYIDKAANITGDALVYTAMAEFAQLVITTMTSNPLALATTAPYAAAFLAFLLLLNRMGVPIVGTINSYISPFVSEKVKQALIAIYQGASHALNSAFVPDGEQDGYIVACHLAPGDTVVPRKFQHAIRYVVVCPNDIPLPPERLPEPKVEPVVEQPKSVFSVLRF